MPLVERSKSRDIAHTLPAKEIDTPRSAFDDITSGASRETTRPLQRALMTGAHQDRGQTQSDGTCPAPDRNPVGPRQHAPQNDGTCPSPESFTQEAPSLMTRFGEALKHGLAKLRIIRTGLPCE
jgi:hypothetical protein